MPRKIVRRKFQQQPKLTTTVNTHRQKTFPAVVNGALLATAISITTFRSSATNRQLQGIAIGPVDMQTTLWTAAVIAAALSLACHVKAQPASAPVPAPAVSATYMYIRPNNSDCVASTAASLDYFPLQFQTGNSSGPTTQQQVNVRHVCWPRPYDVFA